MSRILMTGAAGAVGSYVRDVFADDDVVLTDITGNCDRLDVTNARAVLNAVREAGPDIVLHLAAATDVDRCEREPDWAFATNAIGTHNVALACRDTNATLVYVSTAAVFDGEKHEPYTEFDETGPASVYGRAKLAGEQSIRRFVGSHYIVRAGWMIGGGARDTKFVGKITELIRRGDDRLRVVDDKFGSPTYARDFLAAVRRLVDTGSFGTYHLVNPEPCSRYDVALAIRDIVGRPDLEVEPVSSAYFPLSAPRGRSEALRNYKLELLGFHWMRPWRDALEEYLHGELSLAVSAAPAEVRSRR